MTEQKVWQYCVTAHIFKQIYQLQNKYTSSKTNIFLALIRWEKIKTDLDKCMSLIYSYTQVYFQLVWKLT